ncbi:AMP-binding protein [Paenibacillus sp. FSL R7-0297]|uniref:AMP-binding protein n=1 Tax=Paenibacillus sp. FSL R7-0297 TaxID=2921680 RepID=UPI0030F581C0
MLAQALVASARRHSARAAVRYGGQTLTYEQLITQASAVAAELRRLADRMELPEDEPACGLLFNHGIQGIIGVVASVLAGLVYVPLDASYPPGRLSQIAWHSGIRIMVTDLDGLAAAEAIGSGLPFPEDIVRVDAHSIKPGSKAEIPEKVHKRLYLLYTSGSTGIPKGVVQQGASIVHFAEAYIRELGITADDRLTLFSTFGHDAAVVDIFAGLLSGACLYPLDLRIPENLLRLPGWLEGNGITVWHSVPSLFRTFFTSVRRLPQLPSLRLAVLGGEALRAGDYSLCSGRLPGTKLYSLYGQTESSYSAGHFISSARDASAVGLPLAGTKLLIARGEGSFTVISPRGSLTQESCELLRTHRIPAGELLIASVYVAEGYFNAADASEQAFITSPAFGTIYRTGDMAEIDDTGRIMFRGRIDAQIKIRGYRIEPGEIESHILTIAGVKECAVLPIVRDGQATLTGFIQADHSLSLASVNLWLSQRLPDYMLLSEVIMKEQFPHTLTGKIDRRGLADNYGEMIIS